MPETAWPYPGSRWWKFDFHTHTPASTDTPWHRNGLTLTPQDWLLRYMAAGIDCVAVTDHNSGVWIDPLKAAYAEMKALAESGRAPAGFRELTLFPGVEISVSGGFHLLAIFDPNQTTRTITDLLAAVRYQGTDGDSDGVTSEGPEGVFQAVLAAGGIPIPAHADRPDDGGKGLLARRNDGNASRLDANTLRGIFDSAQLLAVEWEDMTRQPPACVQAQVDKLARVIGSDCHSFQGNGVPGSRYTWVKMGSPRLEGLRLALLDGNDVSIRRSDEGGAFDPFETPAHIIRAIEIERARVIGNGSPAVLELSPFFNAIVGGRGTGKSTVVHALRLATRREAEIQSLPKDSEPRERFEAFRTIAKGHDDKGALKPETVICVEWQHETTRLRLRWRDEGKAVDVEDWRDGQWQPSNSQSVNAARFPLRILSQGQIAEMAGGGRQTLLRIIDEAAGVEPLKQAHEEAQRAFFAQRARLREIDGKLAVLPEVERRLHEAEGKLKALSQADHAAVLQAFARAQHQQRAVDEALGQLCEGAATLRKAADRLLLDDWLPQHFTEADADLLAWRAEADDLLAKARQRLEQEAATLDEGAARLTTDARLATWRSRADAARDQHHNLQTQLAAQGVDDPQAFARLTQERQQLEAQLKTLRQMQSDRTLLVQQIETQQALVLERRQAIMQQRQAFLKDKLAQNPHVRMSVLPFGFDAQVIERSLRELIEVADERFAEDILKIEDGQAVSGLAFDLATATDGQKLAALDRTRHAILQRPASLGGHFRNYLERKAQRPEFADHVFVWYPEDDLRIEYQRDNKWYAISEGSQGQRSAALLAFLLAFGEEPIVLDQPEDDLDNHLIYDLIVRQIRENKLRRQLIVITHNPNVVVNGDAELIHVMEFGRGQCFVQKSGALQDKAVREEVCRVMEGGHEAFSRRWKRLGTEV